MHGRHTRTVNLTKKLPFVLRYIIFSFLDCQLTHNHTSAMMFLKSRHIAQFVFPRTVSYHYNLEYSKFEQKNNYDNTEKSYPSCLLNQDTFVRTGGLTKYPEISCYMIIPEFQFEIHLPNELVTLIVEYCQSEIYYNNSFFDMIITTRDTQYKNNLILN